VYLQVLEEIAARWAAVAVAVSVHSLACHPLAAFRHRRAEAALAPGHAGRQPHRCLQPLRAAGRIRCRRLRCKATPTAGGYVVRGEKAWITHGGIADFCSVFCRTGQGLRAISCLLVPGDLDGLNFGKPEDKMGLHAVPTTAAFYDDAFIPLDRRIGDEGQGPSDCLLCIGFRPAGHLRGGRGIAQAALDTAARYANERTTFGRKIIDHQGLSFLLADMAAAVISARATYLDAARRRDLGRPYSTQASVAKLVATDAA